jgi:hypothetical protein
MRSPQGNHEGLPLPAAITLPAWFEIVRVRDQQPGPAAAIAYRRCVMLNQFPELSLKVASMP